MDQLGTVAEAALIGEELKKDFVVRVDTRYGAKQNLVTTSWNSGYKPGDSKVGTIDIDEGRWGVASPDNVDGLT